MFFFFKNIISWNSSILYEYVYVYCICIIMYVYVQTLNCSFSLHNLKKCFLLFIIIININNITKQFILKHIDDNH